MIGIVDFEFEFVPSRGQSPTMKFKDNEGSMYEIDNKDLFEHLIMRWKDRESDVIDTMNGVTDLKFKKSVLTKVYEQRQDMLKTGPKGIESPAYVGSHIQMHLMPKYRFIGSQMHHMFHALYDQNSDLVGSFIENYTEDKRLHPITGDHIYVYAGVKEVAYSVFGQDARKIIEGQRFWDYIDRNSPMQNISHYYADSDALSEDSGAKMRALREHVSGSRDA